MGDPQGLSSAEAARRLRESGPNEVVTTQRSWLLRALLGFVANPLVLILLAASVISGVVGEALNAALITLMVLLSVGLDFFQVYRSQKAAESLRALVPLTVGTWRDGQLRELPIREIVRGDLVELRAGVMVPADARVESATALMVDEAAMTGESLPVEKRISDGPEGLLLAGTSVVSGTAQAVVTATGEHTQFGEIARSLIERAPPTGFEAGARRFGLLILRTVVALVLFVFLVNALLRRDPLESLLFALALAVGLTPEFLPMIITVTLSQGALQMARSHVIVKRLAAIENLGSMDILCSDKTGTITQGVVVLDQHLDFRGDDSQVALQWACVNSALESGLRSPLDDAILAHEHPSISDFSKVAELPFDFERRRVSVLVEGQGARRVVVKGSPEEILALCTQVEINGLPTDFAPELRADAEATLERLGLAGNHVLGIAGKSVGPDQAKLAPVDEEGLTFYGFAAFLDPPQPTAAATLRDLKESGITVKILSGDSELVSRTICAQVGLSVDPLLTGADVARLSDDALGVAAERTTVFARVSPAQKNQIIRALKRRGHVVGYLGDGINDSPSLHAADVGISVVNGVDVAKAAADIILLEPSLAALHRGVLAGRAAFGNISKYVLMGTSSNFGNMLSMAAATAFLPFLPLLPVQILLNNFLYDLSQIAIPTDNVDASYTAQPRKWDTRMISRFMLTMGPISSLFDFLTFGLLLLVFQAVPPSSGLAGSLSRWPRRPSSSS